LREHGSSQGARRRRDACPEAREHIGGGAGKSAREIRDLYLHRGAEIFPPVWDNFLGRGWKAFRNNVLNTAFHRYSRRALERVLQEFLGDRLLGESTVRHVIPAFDGRLGPVKAALRPSGPIDFGWRSPKDCRPAAQKPGQLRRPF
jgi:hypothetical protein